MPQNDGAVVIQIMGDNSEFAKTLRAANDQVRNFSNELSLIERSLQLNPGNVELLGQKFAALGGQIIATRNKLNELKAAEQEITQKLANGEIGAEQYNAFRREILNTEVALRDLIAAQNDMFDDNGNLRDTTREMEKLGDAIDSAGNSTVTFGDLLKANILSEYVREGINKIANAFGNFVKKGVDLASDLQEVQNVVDTTFGDGANQIYAWADAAAESFGMSSLSAQQYNGTMGAMLKSMGLADDAVVKMSTDMVGLAGDMASFYNLDIEQAFEKIRAGISGETEPLKQLGINMSVANLEAYALSQGIETAYDKMSQSEQAILRYNYLMSVTADAQGDFAKTSDSYANQQRILQLQVDNLAASLGEKLLPHLNDVVGTVIDKLPQAERTIENIGEILGVATSFALEHHEAIISLVTAYGTFYGVMKAGTAIQTAVTSIKALTTATESAKTAQLGMNAAAAANPYVLLASALAAVTVGLVTLANSADTVHNRLKDINDDMEAAYKNADENVKTTEQEVSVIKKKGERYEELRAEYENTGVASEELKILAKELQEIMPEGTQVIDEQSGAYTSLAGAIDSVTEAMLRQSRQAAYKEKYDAAMTAVVEQEALIEEMEARKKETGYYTDPSTWIYGVASWAGDSGEYEKAKERLSNAEKDLNHWQEKINEFREDTTLSTSSASSDPGKYYREYAEKKKAEAATTSKEIAELLKENAKKMQEEWEDAEYAYSTGAIKSEQELYDKKREIWNKYGDSSARDHRQYYKELCEYDKDFAEEQEKLAEEKQKLAEKNAEEELKAAEEQLEEQKKIVDEGLNDILSQYQKAYDELDKKRQAYRNKLMSVGGNLFSVDITEDENGKKTTTYTVNNLEEQLRKMREYHRQIKDLKEQGASEALLSEITSLGSEDSAQFAKYLSQMSDAEFAEINRLYNEKQELADELSQDLYKSEAQALSDSMTNALADLADNSADYGKEAADSYIDAFKTEFDERSSELMDLFRDTDLAAEVKATVEAEIERYSAAAHTAPATNNGTEQTQAAVGINNGLETILEQLNKPVQLIFDGKVIAESVIAYQNNYKRQTGG